MKILAAPDSFKGSIDAEKFCKIITRAVKHTKPDSTVTSMPLADGGEGTVEVLVSALGGRIEKIEVEGPLSKPVKAKIGFLHNNRTAVIESAQAIGLPLAGKRANPLKTSSYGVGQMISYATSKGANHIYLTLGGSSTNDLGAGMLSAMGVDFIDICGNRFTPVGANLGRVENVEFRQTFSKYREIDFTLICDVENPLLGDMGCAAVFSPQKGADESAVIQLEKGAEKMHSVVRRVTGRNNANVPGAGAAGGIAYGALSFLDAKLEKGTDTVLEICKFREAAAEHDLIVTGEGKLDSQSFMGKTVNGVINASGETPVVIFCGKNEADNVPEGVTVIEISNGVEDIEIAMKEGSENLLKCAEEYFASI